MPTHGGRFRRMLLGSTTARVLDEADCPVLTTQHAATERPRPLEHRQWVCGIGLSLDSERVLHCAKYASLAASAKLSLIHTMPTNKTESKEGATEQEQRARQRIAELQSGLGFRCLCTRGHWSCRRDTAERGPKGVRRCSGDWKKPSRRVLAPKRPGVFTDTRFTVPGRERLMHFPASTGETIPPCPPNQRHFRQAIDTKRVRFLSVWVSLSSESYERIASLELFVLDRTGITGAGLD
jgi:Universal stress protein family